MKKFFLSLFSTFLIGFIIRNADAIVGLQEFLKSSDFGDEAVVLDDRYGTVGVRSRGEASHIFSFLFDESRYCRNTVQSGKSMGECVCF
jgi:hypothetical protein